MSETNTGWSGIVVHEGKVLPEWIDVNSHMNVAYYLLAFDHAVDRLWQRFGINEAYIRDTGNSTFAVESHVTWQAELNIDEPFIVTTQLLACDAKRIHQFQRMYHAVDGYLAATGEWMNLHVDLDIRRVTPWPDHILENILAIAKEQGDWRMPDEACSHMQVKAPLYSTRGYDR